MDVCLFWVLWGPGLCIGLITRPEESYRVCVPSWSLDNEDLVHLGLLRHGTGRGGGAIFFFFFLKFNWLARHRPAASAPVISSKKVMTESLRSDMRTAGNIFSQRTADRIAVYQPRRSQWLNSYRFRHSFVLANQSAMKRNMIRSPFSSLFFQPPGLCTSIFPGILTSIFCLTSS
jgi:hypothetical protein